VKTLRSALGLAVAALLVGASGCDDKTPPKAETPEAAPPATATTAAAPDPPRAPDIVVDNATVAVGNDRVSIGETALADKVAVFVTGRPKIEGEVVNVVAMRNAKPGSVAAVVTALRKAKAASVVIKTDSRDGATTPLAVTFPSAAPPDCAAVAWIAKDASINVWPAGGGTAKKLVKGLAGPDMTLGGEAVRKQQQGCSSSALYIGADDVLTWGLAFDLATGVLSGPGARVSSVVLVSNPVPGRKLLAD
jgi:hypothetical protein